MSLEAKNITAHAGPIQLLDDVSVTVNEGEVVGLLGPNGAGKTSLLKAISGELKLSAGQLQLNGRMKIQWSPAELAQMQAVLPQYSQLSFSFSVFEVVLLGRIPHATGWQENERIVRAALAIVDAAHLLERDYINLSGGEKQRVHLARVLVQIWTECDLGSRFLLLDEPTAALDLAHQHMTLRTAREFAKTGVGVLVILHDLNLAAQYADRLLIMKSGRVVASGKPEEVLTPVQIQQVFSIQVSVIDHPQTGRPLVISCESGHNTVMLEGAND